MARPAGGSEYLDAAMTKAAFATTVDELRMAQALLLPLKFGLSLDDTGIALGISKSWTLRLRKRFGRIQSGEEQPKTRKGHRNRARMTFEAEAALLAPHIEQAKQGGVIIVPPLKVQIEAALGRPMALSTVYAMLHRHGWRKLAPDKRHPQSDPVAQEEWEKNSPKKSNKHKNASTAPRR
ncbi:MAG: winged helix-turn-helix domain-containing protein [Thiobacillus sp.]|nr:winged helix-turn-helix domain-containing protein [Thiobacillus sp.]